jgi:hypothetical protein
MILLASIFGQPAASVSRSSTMFWLGARSRSISLALRRLRRLSPELAEAVVQADLRGVDAAEVVAETERPA